VRKAERAWFLYGGEESDALIRVAFDSLGQKQRVFWPYCLSLSSMVAASIPEYFCMKYEEEKGGRLLFLMLESGLIIRNAIRTRVRENIVPRWQALTPIIEICLQSEK
jgi:hypothetical protein